MALFSTQNKKVFTSPLNLDHPILVQVLGICSALAVTSQLKPAIVMGLFRLFATPSQCESVSSCSWLLWPHW